MGNCLQVVKFRYSEEAFSEYLNFNDMMMMHHPINFTRAYLSMQGCRPWGCRVCAMAHPDFGSSVNPISTRWDRLCLPNYYWHPRIFRPSDGPGMYILTWNEKQENNFIDLLWKVTAHCTSDIECASSKNCQVYTITIGNFSEC